MIRALGSMVLALLTLVACQPAGAPNSSPEIVIASDMSTSAFFSSLALEQAVGFAIRQQGSIEGFRLSYWPLDNALGGDQSQLRGRANVMRMVADHRVLGVIGPQSTFTALVEMPIANRAHLAMISPTTTGTCLTLADPVCESPTPASLRPTGENDFFRIAPRDPLQGQAMAHYAATVLGLRRVAAFNELGREAELYIDEFSAEFAKTGGTVFREDVDFGTKDFSAFLKQASAFRAEAVYAVAGADDHACLAAAQMNAVLPGARFLVTDSITRADTCIGEIGVGAAEGMIGTFGIVDPTLSTDPAVLKQVEAYRKAYPRESDVTDYTFAPYDCARILIDAIGRAIRANSGTFPNREQVVEALATTKNFSGVTGTYSFDQNGDALQPMMSIYKVQGGEWKYVPT